MMVEGWYALLSPDAGARTVYGTGAIALALAVVSGCAQSHQDTSHPIDESTTAPAQGVSSTPAATPTDASFETPSAASGSSTQDADAGLNAAPPNVDSASPLGDAAAVGPVPSSMDAATADSEDCRCSFEPCPVDSQRVALPDECCPVCQPCAEVECPAIVCDVGQEPLTPVGQCCPTACKLSDVDPDAYGAVQLVGMTDCEALARPMCNGNGWPGCADNWEDAQSNFRRLCPNTVGPFLARCDHHNAIVNVDEYSLRVFLFDRDTGRLVGFQLIGDDGPRLCHAYDASFVAETESCEPLVVGCSPDDIQPPFDAGVSLPWGPENLPSCEDGQMAYDAFFEAQLDEYNLCNDDSFCVTGPVPFLGPQNPCAQPCDVVLSPQAINSDILARLDTFGRAACARCAGVTQPPCPYVSPTWGSCIDGHCEVERP